MQSQNDIGNKLMARLKTAIEELETTGNSDALNKMRDLINTAANKLTANGDNDELSERIDRYNERLDDLEVNAMLQRDPEMLKSIRAIPTCIPSKSYEKLVDTLETTKTLQGIECEFLKIAINEELDETKKIEYSTRHDSLASNLKRHINPIIIDNLFARYLLKMKKIFDLESWNLHGPADPKEPQSPLQHMFGLFADCLKGIPRDIDIPAGAEIVPISITVNLLAPKEAIQSDLLIIEQAILTRRDELKRTRPDLFSPESRKAEVNKTRKSKTEITEITKSLTLLQKSIAAGKTTSYLANHQAPKEVILELFKKELEAPTTKNKTKEGSVRKIRGGSASDNPNWSSVRGQSNSKMKKALEYLDKVKRNCSLT